MTTPARRENAFCPKALPENDSKERAERLTVGSHPSGSNVQTGRQSSPAPESRGGRRRRSTARQRDRRVPPCSGHPSASVDGGGVGRRAPRRRRALLRRTAARVVEGLVGEGCRGQIEEGVRLLVAREGNERGLSAGDGLTRTNRAGGRGGARRPELGEETSSRSP